MPRQDLYCTYIPSAHVGLWYTWLSIRISTFQVALHINSGDNNHEIPSNSLWWGYSNLRQCIRKLYAQENKMILFTLLSWRHHIYRNPRRHRDHTKFTKKIDIWTTCYQLIPWSWVLEKPLVAQLLTNFETFHETRRFIAVFTWTRLLVPILNPNNPTLWLYGPF
jgi:hypothetical protein